MTINGAVFSITLYTYKMRVLLILTTILTALPACGSNSVGEFSIYEDGLHAILQRMKSLEAGFSECTRKTEYLEQSQMHQASKIEQLESIKHTVDKTKSRINKLENKLNEALEIIYQLVNEVEMTKLQSNFDNTSSSHFQSCKKCEEHMQSQSLGHTSGGSNTDQISGNGNISGISKISRMKRTIGLVNANVAFAVSMTGWNEITLSPHELIPFSIVQLNNGNGFDSNLKSFICPMTGIYFFTASIGTFQHKFEASIVIDGVEKVRISTGDGSGFEHGINSIVTHCSKGQRVYVFANPGGVMSKAELFSMFSGFLIAQSESMSS